MKNSKTWFKQCASAALMSLGVSAGFAHPAAPDRPCPPIPQQLAAEQIQSGMQDARDHGFLWRIRKGDHIYLAPSGVQKEMMQPSDMFVMDYSTKQYLRRPAVRITRRM